MAAVPDMSGAAAADPPAPSDHIVSALPSHSKKKEKIDLQLTLTQKNYTCPVFRELLTLFLKILIVKFIFYLETETIVIIQYYTVNLGGY